MDTINVPETIKALRQKARLTQKQIASAIGCSQANVSYLENAAAKEPNPSSKVVNGLKRLMQEHAASLEA